MSKQEAEKTINRYPDYTECFDDLTKARQETINGEVGKKYGLLTVESFAYRNHDFLYVNCVCDCGNRTIVRLNNLKRRPNQSCGCQTQRGQKVKDITGQKFGSWTVLRLDESKPKKPACYICRCVCGTERSVNGVALRRGKSLSCGCTRNSYDEGAGTANQNGKNGLIDLTGQTFGAWTVLRLDRQKRGHGGYFICRCVCGTEKSIPGYSLRHGLSVDCGCRAARAPRKKKTDLPAGKQFGSWTVIGPDQNRSGCTLCRCVCGTERSVKTADLEKGLSVSCGCTGRRYGTDLWHKKNWRDLSGQTFGNWTVLRRDENEKDSSCFICRCVCGKEMSVSGNSLRQGRTTDCGCISGKVYERRKSINWDYTGYHFGLWTVLGRDTQRKGGFYLCECACGTRKYIRTRNLPKAKDCGCVRRNNKMIWEAFTKSGKTLEETLAFLAD